MGMSWSFLPHRKSGYDGNKPQEGKLRKSSVLFTYSLFLRGGRNWKKPYADTRNRSWYQSEPLDINMYTFQVSLDWLRRDERESRANLSKTDKKDLFSSVFHLTSSSFHLLPPLAKRNGFLRLRRGLTVFMLFAVLFSFSLIFKRINCFGDFQDGKVRETEPLLLNKLEFPKGGGSLNLRTNMFGLGRAHIREITTLGSSKFQVSACFHPLIRETCGGSFRRLKVFRWKENHIFCLAWKTESKQVRLQLPVRFSNHSNFLDKLWRSRQCLKLPVKYIMIGCEGKAVGVQNSEDLSNSKGKSCNKTQGSKNWEPNAKAEKICVSMHYSEILMEYA